jgi:formate dehydrogenase major subunit
MAEAHPVGFRWAMKARERGAKMVHVDPRFSRTSAMCDQHLQIRAGSDIAFLGGMINHVLTTESWFKEYVLAYTNATTVLNEGYVDAEDNGGIFSGFNPETGAYEPQSWMYEGGEIAASAGQREHSAQSFEARTGAGMMTGEVTRDPTLENPRCVLNVLRRHFARYTPEVVEEVCGVPRAEFLRAAQTLIENSGRERTTMFVYSVGLAHHTSGAQIVRAVGILQLLLGNIGRPGGGILALRGTRRSRARPTSRRCTTCCGLPAHAQGARGRADVEAYHVDRRLGHRLVVALRQLHRRPAEGLVRRRRDRRERLRLRPPAEDHRQLHAHFPTAMRMMDGGVEGFFVMGQNPASDSPHAGLHRRALGKLKWLVVRDLAEIETATFWRTRRRSRPAS